MNQLIKEFKDFAVKGNMIDMAVGIIIGGAFGKIITSLVNDVIMPPIGLLVGGVNFTDLKWDMKDAVVDAVGVVTPAVTLNYGNFLQVLFDFLIVAFTIFMFVRLIRKQNKEWKLLQNLQLPKLRLLLQKKKHYLPKYVTC